MLYLVKHFKISSYCANTNTTLKNIYVEGFTVFMALHNLVTSTRRENPNVYLVSRNITGIREEDNK